MRFGVYQLRGHDYFYLMELAKIHKRNVPRDTLDALKEIGLFYNPDPAICKPEEIATMKAYAEQRGMGFMTMEDFIQKVFYKVYSVKAEKWTVGAHKNGKTFKKPNDAMPCMVVGHNLPFDLGGMAGVGEDSVGPARKGFYGGLSLNLREGYARVTIKKIGFAKHMYGTNKKFGRASHVFLNTQQLGRALFGASVRSTLAGMAEALSIPLAKQQADYDGPITTDYISYCRTDVELTWQVYCGLRELYDKHGFTALNDKGILARPIDKVYSEASVGKGYLEQMGVRPFREKNPGFDHAGVTAPFMSAMYGGRSEVRCRLDLRRGMQADFKSQYPTVNALMKLQDLMIAETIKAVIDDTGRGPAAQFLHDVTLADLQRKETWPKLRGVALVDPRNGVLPVRTVYYKELPYEQFAKAQQIGVNEIISAPPCWYTFADVVASKLLTGRVPKILKTITLEPVGIQDGLKTHKFFGDPKYTIDLTKDDLFQRLIDMRSDVKRLKEAGWKPKEQGLKLCANGTSYGVLIEFIVDEKDRPVPMNIYAPGRMIYKKARKVERDADGGEAISGFKAERPGRWFAPWGPLIPAGGRLLLAIAEKLAKDRGIRHGFCDTDSMFFCWPDGMSEAMFVARVKEITTWFQELNPYEGGDPLFNLEDVNYLLVRNERGEISRNVKGEVQIDNTKIDPPWLFAVSAKRYVIANKWQGGWIIRKASGHGLGHITAPHYDKGYLPPHPAAQYKILPPNENPESAAEWPWLDGGLCRGGNSKLFLDLWRMVLEFADAVDPEQDLEEQINDRMGEALETMPGLDAHQMVQQSISTRDEWLSHKHMPWRRAFGFFNSIPTPSGDGLDSVGLDYTDTANRKDLLSTSFYTRGGKDVRILSLAEYKAQNYDGLYRRDNGQFPHEMFNPEYGLTFKTVVEALTGYFTHPEYKSEGRYGFLARRKLVILNQELIGKESHDMLTNPEEPGVDDEDMLNSRLVIVQMNTGLLRSFGDKALSVALGLSEETVNKNLKVGFPLSDETVSRLRKCLVVDAQGNTTLEPLEPTPVEQAANTKTMRRLQIIRKSLSTSGMLAPVQAVINTVSEQVTPGLTATVKGKKIEFTTATDIKKNKDMLGNAIPMMFGGTAMPHTKYFCGIAQAVAKASGAVEFAEKLAKLRNGAAREEENKRNAAAQKEKRAERQAAIISVTPPMLYEDHPLTGEPVLLPPDEVAKVMRRLSRTSSADVALMDAEECAARVAAQKERRREADRLRKQRARAAP